jgi:hypothetical protein
MELTETQKSKLKGYYTLMAVKEKPTDDHVHIDGHTWDKDTVKELVEDGLLD